MNYLHWDQQTITDFSEKNAADMYSRGYVFTRIGKGVMQQTRSVRIDLKKFGLTSENRRVLKKVKGVEMASRELPLAEYNWTLGKTAKDFYDARFGPGIMSAQKVKEIMTYEEKSNFNRLLVYSRDGKELGYAVIYENPSIIHYSYPFYRMDMSPKDAGLGMMNMAIQWAKENGKRFAYLGSLQRPGDVYKLQFNGLEWFDGKEWSSDLVKAKNILEKP